MVGAVQVVPKGNEKVRIEGIDKAMIKDQLRLFSPKIDSIFADMQRSPETVCYISEFLCDRDENLVKKAMEVLLSAKIRTKKQGIIDLSPAYDNMRTAFFYTQILETKFPSDLNKNLSTFILSVMGSEKLFVECKPNNSKFKDYKSPDYTINTVYPFPTLLSAHDTP